ncbi:MAG: motility associated factor glycosyltransferase family protein [Methylocystaceae bacterium]|nr:motility associated factor glycosyltransferase family protein [Methylocystaceae bacterium]
MQEESVLDSGVDFLREKNLSFFRQLNPDLYKRIEAHGETVSEISYSDGKPDNVLINGTPLYGGSSKTFCEKQLADFWKNPERVIFADTRHCNPSPVSQGMMEKANERFFHQNEKFALQKAPLVDVGFCFLFGFGLGECLPELIEKTVARNIFILEPIFEFFIQSLLILDWEDLYERSEQNGITLHFFFEDKPMVAVEAMETKILDIGNTFIDGTYFLIHYPSWEIQEAYKLFRERFKSYYNSSGFFEDELIMMRNSYVNLSFTDFRLIKRKPYLNQDYPVFVLAAGPSLEFDLENIKKIRDQIILVSSGTTIHILLKEGLRPDFHAELENVEAVYTLLEPKHKQYGFEGITLLGSSTLDPKVAPLFDEVYYFARGVVSPTTVFLKDIGPLAEAAPMAANTAVSTIAMLGFRNIYLVGVDCGRYLGAKHHASGSIYEETGVFDGIEKNMDFSIKVPGNFGGEVSTTIFLDMSRRLITSIARRLDINLFNCSHGARIDLAKPISSGAIKLSNPENQQSHIKQTLRDQSKLYRNGEFIDHAALQKNVDNIPLFKSRLANLIEKMRDAKASFYDFDQAFEAFWDDNFDDLSGLLVIMSGSFSSMIRLGAFMGVRIIDQKGLNEFWQVFLGCFEEQSIWMVDQLYDFYSEMVAGKKDISIPESYVLSSLETNT